MRWKVDIPETYKGSQHHRVYISPEAMRGGLVLLDPVAAAKSLGFSTPEGILEVLRTEDAVINLRPEYAKDLKKRLEK